MQTGSSVIGWKQVNRLPMNGANLARDAVRRHRSIMASDEAQLAMKLEDLLSATLLLLLLLGTFAPGVHSATCGANVSPNSCASMTYASAPVANAQAFVTPGNTLFGSKIEAAAVDKAGSIFATDFSSSTSTLGRITNLFGFLNQQVFYNGTMPDPAPSPFYNGLRFVPTSSPSSGGAAYSPSTMLAADETGHGVVLISQGAEGVSSSVFCHDPTMAQPNDIAIAPQAGRVYTSGQKYNPDTVVGDGDLWMCDAGGESLAAVTSSPGLPVKATRLGVFGRTNGIEISPDEKTLYLSEAFNNNSLVISNKIWSFGIDSRSGYVWNQTLFVDFSQLDGSGAVDVDGMRTDIDGNLFVTRNGGGEVIKFSPVGQVLLRIQLATIKFPTNLELGGTDGTSLFILGQCTNPTAGTDTGCVDVWRGNPVPGRAFHDLNSS